MRISKTLMTGAVAAVAVAGTASAVVTPVVIDNFTTAGTLGPSGSGYNGAGTFSTSGWTTGGNYLGSRLLYNNSWGDGTVNSTMSGNGQWTAALTGGTSSDTQLMAQYKLSSVQDLTGKAIYIAGSGTASGGGAYSFQDIDYSEGIYDDSYWIDGVYTGPMTTVNAEQPGYGIGVVLYTGASSTANSWANRVSVQLNMYGSRSLGNFSFLATDFGPGDNGDFDFSQVNAIQVFQYTYNSLPGYGIAMGTWNYTATSFSIVPAPGALALLGVAGLVGGTRRRR
jgi:hypothetical protein